MIRFRLSMILATVMLTAQPAAQAGIVEDLLAIPAIQSMLGRLPELEPLVKRCENLAYQQRNPALCQQAIQAYQLAKMPPELRAVMSTPPAAASLRALCLAAIGTPAYNGYLCTELYRFDATFKEQSQLRQQEGMQKQQEDMQNRQMR